MTLGAIYALIALGYTLVYGVLRLINFAHSEVFMVGAFGSLFALHAIGYDTAHAAPSERNRRSRSCSERSARSGRVSTGWALR